MNLRTELLLCVTTVAVALSTTSVRAEEEQAAARHIPWSGYWFPVAKGELLEPLRKYDALTGSNAFRWEVTKNPPGAHVPEWHGYCHGWAAAAVLEQEPSQQRTVSAGGGSVLLTVGDQKGWYAACHAGDAANWFGDRYGDGKGSEDPNDMRPDMLWQLLKLFIKDQGVPLIMDLDPGPEVWNYPVYAYRIEYQAHPNGNGWQYGQLSLWAADDAVPPDFVGLVPHFQTYQFQFQVRGRAVVAGSSSWIGQSVQDHPDFAWYPYVARPENPELQYPMVQRLIQGGGAAGPGLHGQPTGLGGATGSAANGAGFGTPAGAGLAPHKPGAGTPPSNLPHIPGLSSPPGLTGGLHKPGAGPTPGGAPPAPGFGTPTNPAPGPQNPIPGAPSGSVPQFPGYGKPQHAPLTPQTPSTAGPPSTPYIPGFSPSVPQSNAAEPPPPTPVSPMQMVAAVANRTSKFELDLRAAEFGKVQFAIGERLQLAGTCDQAGYLYLLQISPQGDLSLLYPRQASEDNRVAANATFRFPQAGDYELPGPPGNYCVKAIVTRQPLLLTGLTYEAPPQAEGRPSQPRTMRLCPTQTKLIKSLLQDYVQGKSINAGDLTGDFASRLPEFAQDEFTFYVGPAK